MEKDQLSRKLAVILHADVVGSTALVQLDEILAHERFQATFNRLAETIESYGGLTREVRGDALVAEFKRASDAVSAALAFQAEQNDQNIPDADNLRPELRIGIAIGEVVFAQNTVTGSGVVLAQRIEQLADPGGLCITAAIHEALPRHMPFELENLGEHELKGFDHLVRVYRVALKAEHSAPAPDPFIQQTASSKFSKYAAAGMALVLVVIGSSFLVSQNRQPQVEPTSVETVAHPASGKPSIAVLPFTNMSDDPEQEYFAEGMSEDLITDVSKISGLQVIARHSTFSYKGLNMDVREIGDKLGATHVIEGSVRKAGDTVRITIQLINASDGKHIWAERYDRELRDVFAIQDEVIGEIIKALSLQLTPEEATRVARHETDNLEAYDMFMRGRQQEGFFTEDSFVEAQQYYEQAVALDNKYAEAWARLAQIHAMNAQFGWVEDFVSANQRALNLAEKGINLNPDSPYIRYSYSRILARDSIGQHDRAINEAIKAIELDPNFADAHAWLGQLYILTGQAQKTPSHITVAMRINPNFPFWYDYTYGYAHYFLGEFDTAVEHIELALDRNPNVYFTRLAYAAALAMAGNQDDAEWQIDELFGIGFNKTRKEIIEEHPIRDPDYRKIYDEGLRKAGLP